MNNVTNTGPRLIIYPALPPNLDRFPCEADMAMVTLRAKCTVMLVVLLMASDAACSQDNLRPDGSIVTIDAFELAVLPFELEVCFVVIEIPVFPIARVVAFLAACAECALVRILLFMA